MSIDSMFEAADQPQEQQPGEEPGQAADVTNEMAPQATGDTDGDQPSDSVTPDADTQQGHMVPLAALKDERKKRQQFEERLRQHEQELAYLKGQQSAVQAPQTKAEEFQWTEDNVLDDIPGAFSKVEERIGQRLDSDRMAMSSEMAMAMIPDYREVIKDLNEAAKELPHLESGIQSSRAPAFYAYQQVKAWKAQKSKPQMDEKAIEAEIEKRVNAKIEELQKQAVPTPLSSARGSGAGTANGAAWNGPMSMEALFGGR